MVKRGWTRCRLDMSRQVQSCCGPLSHAPFQLSRPVAVVRQNVALEIWSSASIKKGNATVSSSCQRRNGIIIYQSISPANWALLAPRKEKSGAEFPGAAGSLAGTGKAEAPSVEPPFRLGMRDCSQGGGEDKT